MTELTILDELKTLLPPLSAEEYAGLEESILKDGCLSDLIAWGDILIDGHNRYEICRKHQIPFGIKSIHFESLDDAKFWIWKHQEGRRNLTPFHRAELALKLKDVIAAKAKERQRCGQGGILLPPISAEAKETRQELAQIANVAPSTLGQVQYISDHADEETKDKLRRGEKGTSINKEYKRLKEEQKQEERETTVADSEPAQDKENGSQPSHPNKDVKFVPHTTLKLIPQDSPHVLLVNLFEIFRKGFVEEMVVMAMDMLLEERGKETVKSILAELNKKYGRK